MPFQRTLRRPVCFNGIGLHTGRKVALRLLPAECAITFIRTDLDPPVAVPAVIGNVVNTRLSTTIGAFGHAVASVEHLMAALYATGIDAVRAEVDGPELPVMDGSSLPFVHGINGAGAEELAATRKVIVMTQPVTVVGEGCSVGAYPASEFCITCTLRFYHPIVSCQSRHFSTAGSEHFLDDYIPARTFCFVGDLERMKAQALSRGGSLSNALVIGNEGVVNREGMRFPDEPVRHKILDLAGDLLLAGHRFIGHFRAFRSGHYLNCRLVERILSSPECWVLVEMDDRHRAERETRALLGKKNRGHYSSCRRPVPCTA